MLEDIDPVDSFSSEVYRFVSWRQTSEVLNEMGLSPTDVDAIRTALPAITLDDKPEEFLDEPFRRVNTAHQPQQTRFSDGSIHVFYSAMEWETSRDEVLSWLYSKTAFPHAHYRLLSCVVTGRIKDLRPHISRMPYLVADDGYEACNQIGRAAIADQLHALVTPSARRPTGTCIPVFMRDALGHPNIGASQYLFTCDRATNHRNVNEIT